MNPLLWIKLGISLFSFGSQLLRYLSLQQCKEVKKQKLANFRAAIKKGDTDELEKMFAQLTSDHGDNGVQK